MDIEEFYDANPVRRSSEEFEFGRDWSDAQGNRSEVSWIRDTGELYVMTAPVEPIVPDPVGDEFVQPLPTEAVRVEVLRVIPTLERVGLGPRTACRQLARTMSTVVTTPLE